MNKEILRSTFWNVVVECLVRFHDFERGAAHKKVLDFRTRLNKVPRHVRAQANTLVYHEEPFHIACNIAGNNLDLAQHRATYELILESFGYRETSLSFG